MSNDSSTRANHAQFSTAPPVSPDQAALLRELERGCVICETAFRFVLLDGKQRVRNLRRHLVDGLKRRRVPLIEPACGQLWTISEAGRSALESETAR